MSKKERLAYMAGIVDGEGYIGIKRDMLKGRGVSPVYYERLSVAGINKQMINMFKSFFGCGKIYSHKPSKLSKRGYFSWEVSSIMAVDVLEKIYPYLLIKKPETDLVLELRKSKIKKYSQLPASVIKHREKLYQAVKQIHRPL